MPRAWRQIWKKHCTGENTNAPPQASVQDQCSFWFRRGVTLDDVCWTIDTCSALISSGALTAPATEPHRFHIRYRVLHQTSSAVKKLTVIIMYENDLKRVSRLLGCTLRYFRRLCSPALGRGGGISFLDAQTFLFQGTVVMCSSRCSWTAQGSGASLTYTALNGAGLCGSWLHALEKQAGAEWQVSAC